MFLKVKSILRLLYMNKEDTIQATWDFRSGAQDGDGPSRIKSVKSLGDGWYRYDFLDMGVPGAKKVHITTNDTNDIVIDKLITIK